MKNWFNMRILKIQGNALLIITRKVGQQLTAKIGDTEITFTIKRIRGRRGNQKVEILASAPPSVEFVFLSEKK